MPDTSGNKIYAVDFDGTLSQGAPFPEIGTPNKPLFDMLIRKKKRGARIILNTCRTGEDLNAAVEFCKENGLLFDTVNENLPELITLYGGDTRKINADYYIDDKNMAFPTVQEYLYTAHTYEEVRMIKEYNNLTAQYADQPLVSFIS